LDVIRDREAANHTKAKRNTLKVTPAAEFLQGNGFLSNIEPISRVDPKVKTAPKRGVEYVLPVLAKLRRRGSNLRFKPEINSSYAPNHCLASYVYKDQISKNFGLESMEEDIEQLEKNKLERTRKTSGRVWLSDHSQFEAGPGQVEDPGP
jgi:hypothetical protein